jgi:hypothetical protein
MTSQIWSPSLMSRSSMNSVPSTESSLPRLRPRSLRAASPRRYSRTRSSRRCRSSARISSGIPVAEDRRSLVGRRSRSGRRGRSRLRWWVPPGDWGR